MFPVEETRLPPQNNTSIIFGMILQRKPTALIDLHTDSGSAVPYITVDRVLNEDSCTYKRRLGPLQRL